MIYMEHAERIPTASGEPQAKDRRNSTLGDGLWAFNKFEFGTQGSGSSEKAGSGNEGLVRSGFGGTPRLSRWFPDPPGINALRIAFASI